MTMQRTPLLLSRLMDRGPLLNPREEIVTRTETGLHRQCWKDLKRRACQVASALEQDGIAIGDRVASFLWNNHRHQELYYAVPSMGAVLHTLNIRLSQRDLEYIVNHAADRVVFVDEDLLSCVEALAPSCPTVEKWIVCSDVPGRGAAKAKLPNVIDYEEWIAEADTEYRWPQIDEHSPMGLCYTSGTTGHPKGVMYTHRSTYLHTMAQAMTDSLGLSATDCVLPIVPMFHAMSWGLPFTATMLGTKLVLPNRFMTPKDILDLMEREEVSVSAGVPTIWQGLRAAIEA
ncbi:MAG TPA: AMP-binding protein, partial [Candidatus Binatia bacterium]